MNKPIKIPELKIEVETEIHDKGKCLKDIKIPDGWRLLRVEEIIFLYNNYKKELNMKDTWEFFEQPFKENKEYVARFLADGGRVFLGCYGDPGDLDSSLGVRFCKEIKDE